MAKAKSEKPRKRNAQDATLRNINALKRRVARLEQLVAWLKDVTVKLA